MNTERLAERETPLHCLGSKLNRTVLNSCGKPIIRSGKTRDFCGEPGFFANRAISHHKRSQKRKLTIFGNTKQVIHDYDTVIDNSIPFRKPCRACRHQAGLPGTKDVPWHQGLPSITVIRPQKALQLETLLGGLGGLASRRRQTLTSDFKFVR